MATPEQRAERLTRDPDEVEGGPALLSRRGTRHFTRRLHSELPPAWRSPETIRSLLNASLESQGRATASLDNVRLALLDLSGPERFLEVKDVRDAGAEGSSRQVYRLSPEQRVLREESEDPAEPEHVPSRMTRAVQALADDATLPSPAEPAFSMRRSFDGTWSVQADGLTEREARALAVTFGDRMSRRD